MEPKIRTFSYAEVVESLVKRAGVHSGIWGLALKFGMGASNVSSEDDPEHYLPAAIIPVVEIGIQEFDKPSNLTVDAAKVNPQTKKKSAPRKKSK